ncbi:helix-turn-helix domain-containing protein [Mycolicibacterium sp. CBM1]
MTDTKFIEPLAYRLSDLVPPFPSEDWIRRRLSRGEIPGVKLGREWVMTPDDVQAALAIFRKTGTEDDDNPSGLTAASARCQGVGGAR